MVSYTMGVKCSRGEVLLHFSVIHKSVAKWGLDTKRLGTDFSGTGGREFDSLLTPYFSPGR